MEDRSSSKPTQTESSKSTESTKPTESTESTETTKKMSYEWVYASGAVWVPFDLQSQSNIEDVWKRAEATWIYVGSFRDKAYVNAPELYVHYLGNDLPIARRCL